MHEGDIIAGFYGMYRGSQQLTITGRRGLYLSAMNK